MKRVDWTKYFESALRDVIQNQGKKKSSNFHYSAYTFVGLVFRSSFHIIDYKFKDFVKKIE